jgi:hypothetical protein
MDIGHSPDNPNEPNKKRLPPSFKTQLSLTSTGTRTYSKDNPEAGNESMFTKNLSQSLFSQKQRKKPLQWSEQDTTTFYKCLEVFGTDFAMVRKVLSHLSQRQIARKFHKEKKRNPEAIDAALQQHQSNLISKESKCYSFLEHVLIQTSDSDFFSDNNSDVSLEDAVNEKLRLMNEPGFGMEIEEEPIQPLEYYFQE